MKRILSLLTAALLAGMLALPAFAAEPAAVVAPSGAPVAEVPADPTAPEQTPADPAQNPEQDPAASEPGPADPAGQPAAYAADPAPGQTGTGDDDTTGGGQAGAQTNNTGAYIVSFAATTVANTELTTIKPGDHFNLILQIVDYAAYAQGICSGDKAVENYIAARYNGSAFTYTGTAEVGQLEVRSDGTDSYYAYNLLFRDVVYNGGSSSFSIDLSYPGSTIPMLQTSVALNQCINPEEEAATTRTPQLVVRESSYGTGSIVAGTPFTLTFTLYATTSESTMENLSDVIASVQLPDGVSLTGGSLSQYIGAVKAGGTRQVSFDILPSAAFTGGVANIQVQLTGTGATSGAAVSGSTTISVPIEQPDRFELGSLDAMDTYYVGEGGTVSLGFVNKGQNTVSNLEATISGTNFTADDTYLYIGNLAPGTENSVDFDIYPEMAGPISGVITLTYEYADGSTKTLTQEFSATAEDMGGGMWEDPGLYEPMDPIEEPEPAGLPAWGIALIVAAVAAGIVAAVVLVRRRRKAKAMASLGDDDEDF